VQLKKNLFMFAAPLSKFANHMCVAVTEKLSMIGAAERGGKGV
jgi:hypothetical protein